MSVRLTAAEKKWLADLQAVLDACPSKRLGFFTTGDPSVSVFDETKKNEIERLHEQNPNKEFCHCVIAAGAYVMDLHFPAAVQATCG